MNRNLGVNKLEDIKLGEGYVICAVPLNLRESY